MIPELSRVAALLLTERDSDPSFWQWIQPNRAPSRKDANKFLLGSILDYQMPSEVAWANARRLAETILGDPDDLWGAITSVTQADWMARRAEYALHRFPTAHRRVYTIGQRIVSQYRGDARNIWNDGLLEATLYRLNDLGVGPELSRMVAGALVDVGILHGKADVKVDTHVRRVLGRLFRGEEFSTEPAQDVIQLTRTMHPENPWLLDRPLYTLGKTVCVSTVPRCEQCFMSAECAYRKGMSARTDQSAEAERGR